MNRRIVRNGIVALALCVVAAMLPAGKTEAQACGSNCQICLAMYMWNYQQCVAGCGDQSCYDWCYQQYIVPALETCYQY